MEGSFLSAVQNSDKSLSHVELYELFGAVEDAIHNLRCAVVDDKHVNEARIRLLERKLREARGENG